MSLWPLTTSWRRSYPKCIWLRWCAHLHPLLLWRQRVDDSYPPGFSRQQPHLVSAISPPRLSDVAVPVGARTGGGDVQETPPGGVVRHTAGQRVHVLQDLRTGGKLIYYLFTLTAQEHKTTRCCFRFQVWGGPLPTDSRSENWNVLMK